MCGIPQGPILGPLLFSLYLLSLGSIFRKHKYALNFYADDSPVYVPLKQEESLIKCLDEVKTWMALNFLHFKDKKTEVLVVGPGTTGGSSPVDLGPLTKYIKPTLSNVGVRMDSVFNLDKQISAVVKSNFFKLRQLAKVKQILSKQDFEMIIHALITSHLDYCNSLYYGVSQSSLSRLQLVQNAAARLLTGTRRRNHISPVLASLHWLPVHFRVHFKILLFAFKSLNGLAPPLPL